jgi:uncharacterized membrane protein YadS
VSGRTQRREAERRKEARAGGVAEGELNWAYWRGFPGKQISTTTAVPHAIALNPPLRFLRTIPGVLLVAAIGYFGKLTEQSIAAYGKAHHVALPNIEYVLWAILFGLVVSNTIGAPAIFRPGVATYEFWLKTGIVLLGVRFLLGDILKLGSISLPFVAIELTLSIALMTLLWRWLKLSPKLISLLAIGSSICGVSAIIAAKGAIDADDEDASYAMAAIGVFSKNQIGDIANLSRWAFLLTFAGVGLQTNIRELRKQGLGPLIAGTVGEFAIAGITLLLVVVASHWSLL